MYIYEVNLDFPNETFALHGNWFLEHLNDMVEKNCFENAEIAFEINLDPANDDNLRRTCLSVRYSVKSLELLSEYLEKMSKIMRSEVVEKFGSSYTARRRILRVDRVIKKRGE